MYQVSWNARDVKRVQRKKKQEAAESIDHFAVTDAT